MSRHGTDIRMIAIAEIAVLNPRARNKTLFKELVASIAELGLKKPITVRRRPEATGYDLVCGQGRLEAFVALKQMEIPAIVIDASEHEGLVMSLVENMARRHHTSLELLREIAALKKRGYTFAQVAAKTGFTVEYIQAICSLFEQGEERLLAGVEKGLIPPSVAMEIARAKDGDVQRALAEAYERKTIPGNQFLAIRRIIEQRNATGKTLHGAGKSGKAKKTLTADALVRAYRKETDRQKLMVKKAMLAQSRLLFVINAVRRLVADEHFMTLLRAEALESMPRALAERVADGRAR